MIADESYDMSRPTLTLIGLAGTMLLSSCATSVLAASGVTALAATQERSVGEALDDASISNQIKTKLLANGGMNEVDVEVAGGLVLLSGRVWTPELRLKAETIAWSAKRAKEVANEIRVEAPGGLLANAADEVLSSRVRARLLGSKSVQARNFNVETYDGTVYLLGIARSAEELQKAAEEASYVKGVKQVISYVRLRDDRGQLVPYKPEGSGSDADLLGGPDG